MEPSLLSQSVWLGLSLETRAKLAKLFDFPEKGSVQVVNGPQGSVVISDGYGYDHLKLITTKKMQDLLGSENEDFYALFGDTVMNLDSIIDETYRGMTIHGSGTVEGDSAPIVITKVSKPRGRPRKVK